MVNIPRAQGAGTVQPSLDDFRTAACEAGEREALDTPITVDMNRNVRAVRFKGHLWTQKAADNDGPIKAENKRAIESFKQALAKRYEVRGDVVLKDLEGRLEKLDGSASLTAGVVIDTMTEISVQSFLRAPTLNAALTDPVISAFYRQFLEKNHDAVSFDFLRDVDACLKTSPPDRGLFAALRAKYIEGAGEFRSMWETSDEKINLYPEYSAPLLGFDPEQLSDQDMEGKRAAIQDARTEIATLLTTDSFHRFVRDLEKSIRLT